jgi:hypothetical protein
VSLKQALKEAGKLKKASKAASSFPFVLCTSDGIDYDATIKAMVGDVDLQRLVGKRYFEYKVKTWADANSSSREDYLLDPLSVRPWSEWRKAGSRIEAVLSGGGGAATLLKARLVTLAYIVVTDPSMVGSVTGDKVQAMLLYTQLAKDKPPAVWAIYDDESEDMTEKDRMAAILRMSFPQPESGKYHPVGSGTRIPKRQTREVPDHPGLTPLNAGGGSDEYTINVSGGGQVGAIGNKARGSVTDYRVATLPTKRGEADHIRYESLLKVFRTIFRDGEQLRALLSRSGGDYATASTYIAWGGASNTVFGDAAQEWTRRGLYRDQDFRILLDYAPNQHHLIRQAAADAGVRL